MSLRYPVIIATCTVSILWLIHGIIHGFHLDYHFFALRPQNLAGSLGILTSPFIHADAGHLISNSFAMAVYLFLLIGYFRRHALLLIACIWIIGGTATWCFGRPTFHVGASGITYGIGFFLLVYGFLNRQRQTAAIVMVISFLFGGMIYGIFPRPGRISWESHLFGAAVGFFYALILHWRHPIAQKERDPSLFRDHAAALSALETEKPAAPATTATVFSSSPADWKTQAAYVESWRNYRFAIWLLRSLIVLTAVVAIAASAPINTLLISGRSLLHAFTTLLAGTLFSAWKIHTWRCPRCFMPYFGRHHNAPTCCHCQLPKFATDNRDLD